jgi:transposase-like protein
LRRYRCKGCKTTFNALTATPLAQLHKRELWLGNAQALVDGVSLRKVAGRLDIHVETAFRWRHRFLAEPKAVRPAALAGTVEADETYFLYSQKGQRKLDRPARKRGGVAKKRGLSAEQVPVLIARDRSDATTDQILPDRSAQSIGAALGPVISKTAVLVSDAAGAYRAFAGNAKIAHVALNLSAGERCFGDYHIQNVNNYCSRLKGWILRFRGVATKYLDSYLGWHRADDREGNTVSASRVLAAAWG